MIAELRPFDDTHSEEPGVRSGGDHHLIQCASPYTVTYIPVAIDKVIDTFVDSSYLRS